jgi:hypothetical protein
MHIKEFLRHVWSEQGFYCVVGKDQQNIIHPKFVKTIDEVERQALKLLKDNKTFILLALRGLNLLIEKNQTLKNNVSYG